MLDSSHTTLVIDIYPRSTLLPSTPLLIVMPPRGANAKKESGRAKKAENESKKKETAVAEKVCGHSRGNRMTDIKTQMCTGTSRGI